LRTGQIGEDQVIELGTLLAQPARGRSADDQITVAKLVGLGVQDVAAVAALLERC
jgi:ornithine cyclodeaminase